MFTISVQKKFSSAHKLIDYPGVCQRIHGHNWTVLMSVVTGKLDGMGMSIDFKILTDLLGKAVERLDHQFLNDIEPFTVKNPTAENIAVYIYEEIQEKLPSHIRLKTIEVAESEDCKVVYEK